ncbi:hypothetical protein GCM10010123_36460 [Pilimelia anulata]|uniref:Pyrrolo-quinoline quinone repeat domain-containing protein n=1 Tax=Pilimelia anulata TaxID=53371 RepID=A0A8J3FF51_9ACTN|nr:PQQ-binding-like beta-propeller repeat protein [Pilimelia anulata]GGK03258.1 hypothetical protein GCM10010123_36460 [Pilimelia anulata]
MPNALGAALAAAPLLAVLAAPATAAPARPAPAAPAGPAAAPGWPAPGYDAGGSHYNPDESVLHAGSVRRLAPRWRLPLRPGACGTAGPVIGAGLAVTADADGIAARRVGDGTPAWRATAAADRAPTGLVIAGNLLVHTARRGPCRSDGGAADGLVTVYDLGTGARRWSARDDTATDRVIVDNGHVIVSGDNVNGPTITAYRITDGRVRWTRDGDADTHRIVSTVVADHTLLVEHRGEFRGLDTATGELRWGGRDGWFTYLAAAPGGQYYVGDATTWSLSAHAPGGDDPQWSVDAVSDRIAADGRRVYLGIGDRLAAYDARDGRLRWSVPCGGRVGRPLRAGGLVYAPVAGGPLVVRDAATGARVAAGSALAGPLTPVAVAGGRLYARTGTDRVTVFAP